MSTLSPTTMEAVHFALDKAREHGLSREDTRQLVRMAYVLATVTDGLRTCEQGRELLKRWGFTLDEISQALPEAH